MDSDADPISGRTEPTLLTTGEVDLSWDAGIYGIPNLTIVKESNTSIDTPDGKIIYTIRYANNGIGQANDVVITESIPQYTRYVPEESSPFQCENNSTAPGTSCNYLVGTIPPQTSGTLELVFVVVADTVIPDEVMTINNAVSIDDSIVGGTAIDTSIVQIDRPTPIETVDEPDFKLPKAIFIPLIHSVR